MHTLAAGGEGHLTGVPLPKKKYATAGGTSPCATSSVLSGKSRASADRPQVVAKVKGTANHRRPPCITHIATSHLSRACLLVATPFNRRRMETSGSRSQSTRAAQQDGVCLPECSPCRQRMGVRQWRIATACGKDYNCVRRATMICLWANAFSESTELAEEGRMNGTHKSLVCPHPSKARCKENPPAFCGRVSSGRTSIERQLATKQSTAERTRIRARCWRTWSGLLLRACEWWLGIGLQGSMCAAAHGTQANRRAGMQSPVTHHSCCRQWGPPARGQGGGRTPRRCCPAAH